MGTKSSRAAGQILRPPGPSTSPNQEAVSSARGRTHLPPSCPHTLDRAPSLLKISQQPDPLCARTLERTHPPLENASGVGLHLTQTSLPGQCLLPGLRLPPAPPAVCSWHGSPRRPVPPQRTDRGPRLILSESRAFDNPLWDLVLSALGPPLSPSLASWLSRLPQGLCTCPSLVVTCVISSVHKGALLTTLLKPARGTRVGTAANKTSLSLYLPPPTPAPGSAKECQRKASLTATTLPHKKPASSPCSIPLALVPFLRIAFPHPT